MSLREASKITATANFRRVFVSGHQYRRTRLLGYELYLTEIDAPLNKATQSLHIKLIPNKKNQLVQRITQNMKFDKTKQLSVITEQN